MASDLVWISLCMASSLVAMLGTSLYFIMKIQSQQKQLPENQGRQQPRIEEQQHLQPGGKPSQLNQSVWMCKGSAHYHTFEECQSLTGNKASRLEMCKHCARLQNRQIPSVQLNMDHME